MAVAIRGTTPISSIVTTASVSVTLTGARQPNSGDVLLIIHHNDFYTTSTMPTPTVGGSSSGVTAVTGGTADAGTDQAHAKSFTYVVGSTGDLTVAVTETGSADEEKALVVYVLSGVDTASPVDIAGNATNTGTTTHICPSVDPTSADAYLICHTGTGGGAAAASYTHPSGMTETLDTVSGGLSMGGAVLQLSVDTATGTKTFVPNTSVTSSGNLSIAIKTGGAEAPADSSNYTRAILPGLINPDGKVYLPGVRYDDVASAAPISVDADPATLALAGVDPTISGSGAAATSADVATLTLTGVDPTIAGSGAASVTADAATITFAGVDVAVSAGTNVAADTATLTFTGIDPALSGSGAASAASDVAALIFTGVDPALAGSGAASVAADVAVLTFAGVDVTASSGPSVTADTAILTFTGVTPVLTATGAAAVAVDTATLTLAGVTPSLAGTGVVFRTVDVAVLTFTGVEVGAFVGQRETPVARIFVILPDVRALKVEANPRTRRIVHDPRTVVVLHLT
jgi:hypothetical protein